MIAIDFCRAFVKMCMRKLGLWMFVALVLGVSNTAFALTFNSAQLNGASTTSVAPGANVAASFSVSGNFFETWQSTQITSSPSGLSFCDNNLNNVFFFNPISGSFNVAAPTSPGVYNVTLTAYNNTNCTGTGASRTLNNALTVIAPLSVVSIARINDNPTNATTVRWLVTFNRNVTGVNASDFDIVRTGVSSPDISVSPNNGSSSSTWTVTASDYGNNNGTLRLDLDDDDSIRDASNNSIRLGGTGNDNGNFTGEPYTIERTRPTVVSIVRAGVSPTSAASVDWTVTFSESVKGVVPGRFTLTRTGLGGTSTVTSVVDNGDGVTWTVTATTGTGSGTIRLNITAASGVGITDLAGNTLNGLPENGEVYTIDPNAPSECFIDSFDRANGVPGANWSVGHESGTFGDPRIVSNRFRLTDASTQASTYATLQRIFPGAGNKIVVEFNHYAYGGNGADGIAMVLSDASKLPVAGAFGGSLGYAPKQTSAGGDTTHAGFVGGWLGVALDEFGNFSNPTEGRIGGPGQRADSVTIRGSGTGFTGYSYLAGTGTLGTGIDTTSNNAGPGYRYRITVDHSDSIHAYTKVERDTSGNGTNYTTLINQFDAKAAAGQAAVPTNWSLSFTGSTGGNSNIHEFTQLQVCSVSQERLHHIQLDHPPTTCSSAPVTVKACSNADCSSLYVGKVSVNLANVTPGGSWSTSNQLTFFNGQTTVTLNRGATPNVEINIGATAATSPPATNATVCTDGGGNATNCVVQFSSACTFEVVEPGAAPGTPIYTKLVNRDFSLDIRPTDLSGVPASHTGTVTASAVDASALGTCNATQPSLQDKAVTFAAGDTAKPVTFNINNAYKDVRIRVIADGTLSCSKDNFAIRPESFVVTTSVPGCTSRMDCGSSSFVAGDEFNVTVTPTPPVPGTTGYAGNTPILNKQRVTDHTLAPVTGTVAKPTPDLLSGTLPAAASAGVLTGISSGTFTYADVGTIVFGTDAVTDKNFTAVDQVTGTSNGVAHGSVGDCIPDSLSDPAGPSSTSTSNTMVGGKYGCTIGSLVTAPKGRFKPDHYEVTASLSAACTNTPQVHSFTYMDQPALGVSLIARAMSKGGTVLSRYTKSSVVPQFPPLADITVAGINASDATDRIGRLVPALPPLTWTEGMYDASGTYAFTRQSIQDGSYEEFKLRTSIIDTKDAIKITKINGTTINDTMASSLPTSIRFGRLRLLNANGSEKLDLPVKMWVEYWNGTSFVINTDDNCTTFQPNSTTVKNTTSGISGSSVSGTAPINVTKGTGSIILKKPTQVTGKGSVDICVDLDGTSGAVRDASCAATVKANLPWLQGAWNGTAFDDDPTARVTFGVFKSGPVIYLRELY